MKRFAVFKDDVLRFASDFRVAFDNNLAERAIRMIKLQIKISGSWRTWTGVEDFLTIRSYLATAGKHDARALDVLTDLFQGRVWALPTA